MNMTTPRATLFTTLLTSLFLIGTFSPSVAMAAEPSLEPHELAGAEESSVRHLGFAIDGLSGVGLTMHLLVPDEDGPTVYAAGVRLDQLQTILGKDDGSIAWVIGVSGLLGLDLEQRLRADARLETGAAVGLGFATLFPLVGGGVEKLGPISDAYPEGAPLGGYGMVGLKARVGIAFRLGMDLMALYHIREAELSHLHLEARLLIGYGSPFFIAGAYDHFSESRGVVTSLGLAW